MIKNSVLVPAVTAGAGLAVLAYLVSRRVRAEHRAGAPREPLPVPGSLPDPADLELDLDGIFAGADAEIELPTVQCDVKLPLPMGGDDAEAIASSEVGRDWLSRATESERSLTEADLEVDLDDIPASFDERS